MATRITRNLVCDICEGDKGVQRWRVVKMGQGKQVSVDLCERPECSGPFEHVMEMLPQGKRSQVRRRQVKTPGQVKALRSAK